MYIEPIIAAPEFKAAPAPDAGKALGKCSGHPSHLRGQLVADATICAVSVELLPEPVMLLEAELLLLEES